MKPEYTVKQGALGQWYWTHRAANGETMSCAEGYATQHGAIRGARAARKAAARSRIVVRDETGRALQTHE